MRVDLRGFGDSAARPGRAGLGRPVTFSARWLKSASRRCHLVGASFGAGVAVEVALTGRPAVASLLLAAPGGSLLAEVTPDLQAFFTAERTALDRGDLDAAVKANLSCWGEGPQPFRWPASIPRLRELVGAHAAAGVRGDRGLG